MPPESANVRRSRKFRGFKTSPWTASAETVFAKSLPSRERKAPVQSKDVEHHKDWDVNERRAWIQAVERRSAEQRRQKYANCERPKKSLFVSLPIESTGHIPNAYEFFKNIYAPMNSFSPGFDTYCQVVLQDTMLFEQVMAYSLVMQNTDKLPRRRMTAHGLLHSNNSVIRLRQRLESPSAVEQVSDTVIMTIVVLISVYVICGDFRPWKVHMQALRGVVAARGGSDKLGWGGFLETKVKQIEAAWSTIQIRETLAEESDVDLEYPSFPFPPTLCSQVAKLPPGFRELALRHRLSIQFIDVLEKALERTKDLDNPPSAIAITSTMEEVVCRPELTSLERCLAVAVTSCSVARAKSREGVPPYVGIGIQLHARSLPTDTGLYRAGSPEEEALDWAALALRSTCDQRSTAWTWANQRMNPKNVDRFLEDRKRELQKRFLEIPG